MEIIENPYISELSKNRDNYRAWARAIMEDVVILYLISSRPPQLGPDVMCICMHACTPVQLEGVMQAVTTIGWEWRHSSLTFSTMHQF